MFQLNYKEWNYLQSQFVTEDQSNLMSQFVTSSWGGNRKIPYAFTEQGVAMLSGILKSDKAINMNIAIMRAFVTIRKVLLQPNEDGERLKERIEEHDTQLNQL